MEEFEQLIKAVDEYVLSRSIYRRNREYGVALAILKSDEADLEKAFLDLKAKFDKYLSSIPLTKQ